MLESEGARENGREVPEEKKKDHSSPQVKYPSSMPFPVKHHNGFTA